MKVVHLILRNYHAKIHPHFFLNNDIGCMKFVVKTYIPSERFSARGKFSQQQLDSLQICDTVNPCGPVKDFDYVSNGKCLIDGHEFNSSKFNMIAGGTSITPVMQIVSEILCHPEDKTQISPAFACWEENDLLKRSTLEEWTNLD